MKQRGRPLGVPFGLHEQHDSRAEHQRKQRDELLLEEDVTAESDQEIHPAEITVLGRIDPRGRGPGKRLHVDHEDTENRNPSKHVEADDPFVGCRRSDHIVTGTPVGFGCCHVQSVWLCPNKSVFSLFITRFETVPRRCVAHLSAGDAVEWT